MITIRPARAPSPRNVSGAAMPQQSSSPVTFPAPAGGLVTTRANTDDQPGTASIMENFFPTLTGCRLRGGSVKSGLAADGGTIRTAFRYAYGDVEKMFMATDVAIYDMTTPVPPPGVTVASVTGLAGGDWSTFQHTTAAGAFLICTNGLNGRRLFNGTTWSTTPAVTFSDSTTEAQLSYGWLFKNREFYIKSGTLDAYYLPVNQIGGAASVFPLGGVMKKGGTLVTGFSWSLESGDGLGDFCAFVSSEGELAIYSGSDPSSASDFGLRGVYQIGKPLGKSAWIRAGADVLVATVDGLMPVSQVFQRDREALSLVSVSRPIEDDWRMAVSATNGGWYLTPWEENNLVFVSFPDNPVMSDVTFVLNVLTGRWSTVSNWRATCYVAHQRRLFFGGPSGYCWQGDITGSDDGLAFRGAYLSQFTAGGAFGVRKTATMAQMFFRGRDKPRVRLFAKADMDISAPSISEVTTGSFASSLWDVGKWDVATWDGSVSRQRYRFRQNVRATGDMLAVGCVIASSGEAALDVNVELATMQTSSGEASA